MVLQLLVVPGLGVGVGAGVVAGGGGDSEGEVGPQTYARRKGELTVWLAAVLRELGGGAAEPEAATA